MSQERRAVPIRSFFQFTHVHCGAQTVHGIGGLRVRCPELELRHEQDRHEATLRPLLDEADALRARAREQHTQVGGHLGST
jgi:hypothetical protein